MEMLCGQVFVFQMKLASSSLRRRTLLGQLWPMMIEGLTAIEVRVAQALAVFAELYPPERLIIKI